MKSEESELHFITKKAMNTPNGNTNFNSSLLVLHSSLEFLTSKASAPS